MPRSAGHLNEKAVIDWFSGLDFEKQASLLASLEDVHAGSRQERIEALRAELAALERALPRTQSKSAGKRRRRSSGTVQVKYRHPKTGETWSGRGRMARWLAERVQAGEKPEKYFA